MKKVFFIVDNWTVGGMERMVNVLLESLPREDLQYSLVVLQTQKKEVYVLQERFPYPKKVSVVEFTGSAIEKISGLMRFIKKERPRLLVTHMGVRGMCFLSMALLFSFYACGIIVVHHNRFLLEHIGWLKKRIAGKLMQRIYAIANIHISVSEALRGFITTYWGVPPHKIITIYNPIDEKRIQELAKASLPDDIASLSGKPKVIMVSRLSLQKDHRTLIKAFKKVVSQRPSYLILLGEGEEKEKIEKLITELNLEHEVLLFGNKENPYVYIAHSDIFVLSTHFEGLPTVLLEAMCCSVPIISSDCDFGPREILEEGKDGILVPVGDVDALAKGILTLLENRDVVRNYVHNSQKRVQDFSRERIVAQYEKLITQLTRL